MRPLSSLTPAIRPGRPGLAVLVVTFGLLLAGCGGKVYVVTSLDQPRAIVVDGNADDWTGALSYVASDHLFVGFVNDRDNLFICLTKEEGGGSEPGRRGGWTVWFDPAGGTNKAFGLRVASPNGESKEGRPGRKPVEEPAEPERGEQVSPVEPGVELQWLGSNGNVQRKLTPEDAAKEGLEVAEGHSGGSYVLEIKIPLGTSGQHNLAAGAGPGGLLGVGFFSNPAARNGRRGGPPGGGTGGEGGRHGGGGMTGGMGGGSRGGAGGWRGAMEPNMNPDVSKGTKIWTQVRLRQSDQPGRSTILRLITY